jgi:FkbM family methyltransferase
MSSKKIFLNMIVKNESKIIERLLSSVKNIISGCIITDTGSSDNTKEIIIKFCNQNNIYCDIKDAEFINFEHARNTSLKYAQESQIPFDYILLLDADHELKICDGFDIELLTMPVYLIKQGTSNFFYSNVRLIQKNIDAKYIGCTHEYLHHDNITTQLNTLFINDINDGGCKSDKFERDINLLIKGIENEPNNTRYHFYLANSYKDTAQYEKAVSMYEKVLELNGWSQEKYYSCHKLFECCSQIGNIEKGLYYLTTSYLYDDERSECIYELVKFYCAKKMDAIAMKYYELIKDKYETSIMTTTFQGKLFVTASIPYFYLPYYLIIVSINMKSYKTAMFMYEIIFKKKQKDINQWWISNVMFNYKFVKDMISDNGFSHLRDLYKSYVKFLFENNYNIREFISDVDSELDSELDSGKNNYYNNIVKSSKYKESKKILFYVGYSLPHYKWNKTISLTSPMGGSEKALSYLIDLFPKCYDIYVCGNIVEERVDNIHFIHSDKLKKIVEENEFHSVIMSRYIELILNYKFKCYKLYIWAHDRIIRSLSFINNDAVEIINNCIDKIDGCICLTKWHKEHISKMYNSAELERKIFIINNGIEINNFPKPDTKIKNTFIYTSRSERGLKRVLELWESISKNIIDAHLTISSYNAFPDPKNKDDIMIEKEIKKYSNIIHLGKLNEKELYSLMNKSEYWLYPSDFYETSCITAMEMLKSRVICLYYPIGGLVDTINNHGVRLIKSQEVNQILSLMEDEKHKQKIVIEGEKYADTCSWENRYKQWEEIIFNDKIHETSIINNHDNPDNHDNHDSHDNIHDLNYTNMSMNFLPKSNLNFINSIYLAKNNIRNMTINYIKNDNCIGKSIKDGVFWEEWMEKYIKQNYVKNTNMIDLGGNIGTTTLLMSEILSDKCKIFTFEPIYSDILLKNILENNLTDKVLVYPYGVGNIIKTLKIKPVNLSDNINFGAVSIIHNLENKDDSYKINIVPLDYFNFDNVSLIKIDVEHMEIQVLEGCLNLIKRCKPTIIIETYQLTELKKTGIFKELMLLEYEIYEIPEGYRDYIMKIKNK